VLGGKRLWFGGEPSSPNVPVIFREIVISSIAKNYGFNTMAAMSSPRSLVAEEESTHVKVTYGRSLLVHRRGVVLAMLMVTAEMFGGVTRSALSAEADAIRVSFDRDSYEVRPNQDFQVKVTITPPPAGLFSYGVRITFPSTSAAAAASDSILIPSPLDFGGVLGAGAFRQVSPGSLAVKGTVEQSPNLLAYSGELLAMFNLTAGDLNLGNTFSLGLDLFRTLGPTESIFVDGQGNPLDGRLQFGGATVTVVPEPEVLTLLSLPLLLAAASARRWSELR
jgi:hypothetical protein